MNRLIRLFSLGYAIALTQAEHARIEDYESFNHFFTRALKPGARPLPDDPQAFISPVDGTVSQFGRVTDGRLFQAQGHNYSIHALLPEDAAVDDLLVGEIKSVEGRDGNEIVS